ncbi:hypothetical protein NP493_567g04028 [Ridgeia piscesae]|uniref:Uncharacterized protein n=1 Tax=Ridgeia piscesae TaxID=27915 RepID=A0AAD9KV76_RIDPI|nr:hypothetical protein NP493_567g04028 [Ridgeia piscesae]
MSEILDCLSFSRIANGTFDKLTSLTKLALMNNAIYWLPPGMFSNSKVKFLGLEGNQLKAISRGNMLALSTSPLQHLELHQNKLANIPAYTFDGIAKLLHLELNHNLLKTVGTEAITNLPELITLILHSQDTPMELIQYDAFRNIGSKLESL